MWRLENDTDVEKVETVFFEVGKSLSFVPFIAHSYIVIMYTICVYMSRASTCPTLHPICVDAGYSSNLE